MPDDRGAQPNLILITTDQHRWDALGVAGNPVLRTPHLDRLAREGAWFSQCITPSPICVAARSALLTGCAPGKIGTVGNSGSLPDPNDTLPAHLTGRGYFCQAIGKMHFVPRERRNGFHNLILSEETRWLRGARSAEEVAFDDYDRFLLQRGMYGWDKPPEIGYNEIKPLVSPLPPDCHVTGWCGQRTVDWLRARPSGPFFLWCSFVKPHMPFDPPAEWADRYDPSDMPPPGRTDDELRSLHPKYRVLRRDNEWHLYSEEAERQAKAYYYANIEFVDEQVGRVLDAARDTGALDNALVIFTSDHGELLGDHWLWAKGQAYEGSLRVPLIIWGPRWISPGLRSDATTSLLDVFPTLWNRSAPGNLSGASVLSGRPGRDLVELAASRESSNEPQYVEFGGAPSRLLAVRSREWKYAWHENGGLEELFNLRDDPHEFHNLAEDAGYAAVKRDLRDGIKEWIHRHSDPRRAFANDGGLPSRPFAPSMTRSGPRPFGRPPWQLRVPPNLLPASQVPWWWEGRIDHRAFLADVPALHAAAGTSS